MFKKSPFSLLAVGLLLIIFGFSSTIPDNTNGFKLLSRYTLENVKALITPSPKLIVKASPVSEVLGATDENAITVKKVIDGDTIQLENGEKLRYIGIDTPETVDPRRGVQCYGHEASDFNKSLVLGKKVRLVKDVSERDSFGRLLRYVYLISEKPEEKEVFVNELLVRQGYAYAVTFPPDIAFQSLFQEAQKDAKLNNRGLWSACPAKK